MSNKKPTKKELETPKTASIRPMLGMLKPREQEPVAESKNSKHSDASEKPKVKSANINQLKRQKRAE